MSEGQVNKKPLQPRSTRIHGRKLTTRHIVRVTSHAHPSVLCPAKTIEA